MNIHATFRQTALLRARLDEYKKHLDRAKRVIGAALRQTERPYIAYSSGKDSTVMAHLVWEQSPDVPGVYFDADCAFPESAELIEREAERHTIIRWKTEPLLETFQKHGGPTAHGIGRRTMDSTVYQPLRGLAHRYRFDLSFIGLRAGESKGRFRLIKSRGELFLRKDGVWECLPVGWWTHWDIWAYILSNGVDYNRAYDKMLDMPIEDQRISYWAGETKAAAGRYVFLKRHYLGLYNQLVDMFPEVGTHT